MGRSFSPRTRGYFLPKRIRTANQRLFPAHAGVFPWQRAVSTRASSFPRARGGISIQTVGTSLQGLFSPRTRGYFQSRLFSFRLASLFPAHAGVFPSFFARLDGGSRFSPRTRGYFRLARDPLKAAYLFPAHAGVFPSSPVGSTSGAPFPRARGGISYSGCGCYSRGSFSPRTRGYFLNTPRRGGGHRLFPAHAGVFPGNRSQDWRILPFPRARGGISRRPRPGMEYPPFSPRTRGYFRLPAMQSIDAILFPAHAGVFPIVRRDVIGWDAFPRARGGISASGRRRQNLRSFSPRTRGYFRDPLREDHPRCLFPAHAGVFPAPD